MASATVPVKSAFLSKINWTQAIAFAAMMFSIFGVDLDAKTQADMLAGVIAAQSIITWVLRTFFTTSVTPSAAGK